MELLLDTNLIISTYIFMVFLRLTHTASFLHDSLGTNLEMSLLSMSRDP
jgi:hypothetical protein